MLEEINKFENFLDVLDNVTTAAVTKIGMTMTRQRQFGRQKNNADIQLTIIDDDNSLPNIIVHGPHLMQKDDMIAEEQNKFVTETCNN